MTTYPLIGDYTAFTSEERQSDHNAWRLKIVDSAGVPKVFLSNFDSEESALWFAKGWSYAQVYKHD